MSFIEFINENVWGIVSLIILLAFNLGVYYITLQHKADKIELSDKVSRKELDEIKNLILEIKNDMANERSTSALRFRQMLDEEFERHINISTLLTTNKYYSFAEGKVLENEIRNLHDTQIEIKNAINRLTKQLTNIKE